MAINGARSSAWNQISRLVIFLATFSQVCCQCPEPWQYSYSLDRCYTFDHFGTFDDSVQFCKDNGGRLAQNITDSVLRILSRDYGDLYYHWVGIEDTGDGNGFKFLDGSDIYKNTKSWKDEKIPQAGSSRMCVRLIYYKLEVLSCIFLSNALCEREKATCPDHWYPAAGDCVKLFKEKKPWEEASQMCQTMGAKPLRIPTHAHARDIHDYLNIHLKSDIYQIWTGAKHQVGDKVLWFDGGDVEEFEHFNITEEDATKDGCGYFSQNGTNEYRLTLTPNCDNLRAFVCFLPGNSVLPTSPQPANPPLDPGKCGKGWESRPGTDTCYSFLDTTLLNMFDAEAECNQRGGSLVSINSRDEHDYLQGRLEHMIEDVFWIGLWNYECWGWSWDDDTAFAYTYWADGQPKPEEVERRVYLYKDTMEWRITENDHTKAAAICEKHCPAQKKTNECERNWFGYGNNCYFLSKKQTTWHQARDECQNQDAQLAMIQNVGENDFILSLIPGSCADRDQKCDEYLKNGDCESKPFLMSGLCPASCEFCDIACRNFYGDCHRDARWSCDHENPHSWKWKSCAFSCGCDPAMHEGFWIGLHNPSVASEYKYVDSSAVNFTFWRRYEPNNFEGKKEDCVLMHQHYGEWSDEVCDKNSTGFVCQKPMTLMDEKIEDPTQEGCPPGSHGYRDKCYTLVVDDGQKTWSGAQQACEDSYLRLAVVDDIQTNGRIGALILEKPQHGPFWIGLSHDSSGFLWTDGSVPKYAQSSANLELGECAVFEMNGQWGAHNCTEEHVYVCESDRAGHKIAAPILPPDTESVSCHAEWLDFRDNCYRLFNEKKTWPKASDDCEDHDGLLVSIHDKDTNDVLWKGLNMKSKIEPDGAWIGLYSPMDTQGFIWSDENALTYENWIYPERPEDTNDGIDCIGIYTGKQWWKYDCNTEKPYICQVSKVMLTAESIDVKDPDGGNTQDMGDLEKPAKPADTPSNKKKSKETGGLGKLSGGAIAGVVFGTLGVFALVAVALIFAFRRSWFQWRQHSIDSVKFVNSNYDQDQISKVKD